jgi:4-amino-4-deoxy-L-arabinose transferase-like glycosyltransferase
METLSKYTITNRIYWFVLVFLCFTIVHKEGDSFVTLINILILFISLFLVCLNYNQIRKFDTKSTFIWALVIFYCVFSFLIIGTEFNLNVFLIFSLKVFVCILVISLLIENLKNRECFFQAVEYYAFLSAFILLLQVGYFYLIGDYLAFHNYLFPFSRDVSDTFSWGIVRFSGFQLEPGLFCNLNVICIVLSIFNRGKIYKWHYIGLGLNILTSSVNGALLGISSIILLLLVDKKSSLQIKTLIISAIVLILLFSYFYLGFDVYISSRFTERTDISGSDEVKLNTILYLMDSSWDRLVFGSGLFINDTGSGEPIESMGTLFSLFFYMGFFGIIVFLYFVYFSFRKSLVVLVILIICLFAKWKFNDLPLLITLSVLISSLSFYKNDNEKTS